MCEELLRNSHHLTLIYSFLSDNTCRTVKYTSRKNNSHPTELYIFVYDLNAVLRSYFAAQVTNV